MLFIKVQMLNPVILTWPQLIRHHVLSEGSDFHMIDNLLIAILGLSVRKLTLLSVDEILLSRYMNSF